MLDLLWNQTGHIYVEGFVTACVIRNPYLWPVIEDLFYKLVVNLLYCDDADSFYEWNLLSLC